MGIIEIANRIANLHYPDIPKTRGDKMFRRQRVIELQKLVESELKNCSIFDVVGQSEQFTPKQLYTLAQRHSIQDFQKILKEAPTWKG